ncbi:glycosyltransferase [Mucilaginibacter lacusdianchii]|uniref:glycosyltransferase n=1 Tax=Mucilaginibacter lacusdianchii TaxID=2684211 RepID=UPI00131DE2DC|nr:glycosyltransferase [Mucilaginibacter sp. JXJ CY 39]
MTLEGKFIVILGNTRFDGFIQSTSFFIARNLAKKNKVFFIEYPFTLKDYIQQRKGEEVKSRRDDFKITSTGIKDTDMPGLKVIVCPPVLPINFLPEGKLYRAALKFNELLLSSRINKALKSEGVTNFIYINAFNFHYPGLAKYIKPSYTVYQCVDPMIVPYDIKHGIQSENELVKTSNLVICTSKALYEEKKQQNPNTYLVPNGADVHHFATVLDPAVPVHPKLNNVRRPVIGYIGSIERRIDYPLLVAVVAANADKSFILAGPHWPEYIPEQLLKAPNVKFIGPVLYDEAPQLLKGFDVAIIPFKKDEVSRTLFPLKLFEYLAAGKPVISTDFNPDLQQYTEGAVRFAADANAFNQAIEAALQDNAPNVVAHRSAVAANNSWEKRTESFGEIINAQLSPQMA